MNAPMSTNKFVPKQALAPTPQLYDELVGDSMEKLAQVTLAQLSPLPFGSIIHDNGCGTGAATAAIFNLSTSSKLDILIHGTDINPKALELYTSNLTTRNWPATATQMDSQSLTFPENTFTHSISNALLFVLPDNGIDAVKETYRTLKPGGTALFNSWFYVPTMAPLQTASRTTRAPGTPLPRDGMAKWSPPEFLRSVIEKGGFEKEKVRMEKVKVVCQTTELGHFAEMLWSFIGGTSEAGWGEGDEENWERAVGVVKGELEGTEGFRWVGGGRAELEFVANVAVAVK
ncbi:S-adenosyl-L-methionine-dependent methyltransferase [Glarea lozoyensis ATCC 20868]|uniref:S-adenosyl-L-methionine-dependent methyltransferase n=2 Tax=Glarea lozoyensis TaxID=101852 RepID=S3D4L8_GLAL2|nr:S-adenosyl-L-methionine-dependent methyltransferase [Glarea lozoyensis ATCC 20868]EHL00666.1 hypothetical protein M7I_3410 [Glarea lozoyensis 74030]EPE27021.1 S-adenosyl-L-methionine-dependent methyltransferase [Glarea lozoyensis ATCC 20868]